MDGYCMVYSRKPRVALYYRVSKRSKNNVRMQRRVCKEYCLSEKMKFVSEYVDKGFSGRTKNRPALKKLLLDVSSGKIDRVLVYKVDRLGRNFTHLNGLIEDFDKSGVQLVSATQNIDNTAEGKFMLRMLTGLAELESEMTSKRVRDGIRAGKG